MFSNLGTFYYDGARAALQDALKEMKKLKVGKNADLRLQINAAKELHALREYWEDEDPTFTQRYVQSQCPDFELLADTVNASKHKKITRKKDPLIKDSSSIIEERVSTKFRDNLGEYEHVTKRVVLELTDGTERDLLEVIINVNNYFAQQLYDKNLLPFNCQEEFRNSISKFVPRSRAIDGKALGVTATANIYFRISLLLQIYDVETGVITRLGNKRPNPPRK